MGQYGRPPLAFTWASCSFADLTVKSRDDCYAMYNMPFTLSATSFSGCVVVLLVWHSRTSVIGASASFKAYVHTAASKCHFVCLTVASTCVTWAL